MVGETAIENRLLPLLMDGFDFGDRADRNLCVAISVTVIANIDLVDAFLAIMTPVSSFLSFLLLGSSS